MLDERANWQTQAFGITSHCPRCGRDVLCTLYWPDREPGKLFPWALCWQCCDERDKERADAGQ